MENPIGFTFAPQLSSYGKPQLSSPHQRIQHIVASHSPRGKSCCYENGRNLLIGQGKRKRSPDDFDMESSTPDVQQSKLSSSPVSNKKIRSLPVGRPLPLSRLLEDLDKSGLQELIKNLCERHPGLNNEIYKHAPKPSVSRALATLSTLERNVQTAFPFGGETKGEYAYNRVLPHIKELLNALMDYVPQFLPPVEEHALETLAFVDGATSIISRLPDWNNPNHALTKREAFEEINGAWIQGFKEASKRGAGLGAASFLDRLRRWNESSGGMLDSATQSAAEELGWVESTYPTPNSSEAKTNPLYGLFSR